MPNYSWNSNVHHRNLNGRHILIDAAAGEKFIEVSPLLGELFSHSRSEAILDVVSKWRGDCAVRGITLHDEEVQEMLNQLADEGYIHHDNHA